MEINIVLYQPEIPQNTGNIARTCAATGAKLHIIRPLGFKIDDTRMKRAGLDYWSALNVQFYEGIEDFNEKHKGVKVYYFTTKATNAYSDVFYSDDVFLMFGPETRGLPEELLRSNKDRCVRIPMLDGLRSLNLSNSVAIAVFEVLRQNGFEGLKKTNNVL